jgi:hypothetical protein
MIKEMYFSEMVYIINSVFAHFNETLKNCPTRDLKCFTEANEKFAWDTFKGKYFFKEKLFEI